MKLKTKFQDEIFKLGEVVDGDIVNNRNGGFTLQCRTSSGGVYAFYYKSLKELNDAFKDFEEPKEYWHIDSCGGVFQDDYIGHLVDKQREQIGNRFETEDDAKKALEKLKAITRLQNKGFRFDGYDVAHNSNGNLCGQIFYNAGNYCIKDIEKDLCLLFREED